MSNREKALRAIKRESGEFVPYHFDLCPSLSEEFFKRTGERDYHDYYKMAFRFVYAGSRERNIDFSKYFKNLKEGTRFNEFGVAHEAGSVEHFSHMRSPMQFFEDIKEYEAYPYPDAEKDYDWERVFKDVQKLKEKDCLAVGAHAITIFEIGWYLRGMEEFMIDMFDDSDTLKYHLERICAIRCRQAELFCEAGVDILHLGDDIATQLNMMFSLEQYQKWIKPFHKRVIDSAKRVNPSIIIDYHSDGNCSTAIPDLIEIGVDILNPIQPECMDVALLKKQYGDKLSFRGAVGTQTTMPFGTPSDVKKTVKGLIETVGKGGGLILAPSHLLEPEVPFENIEAFIEAVNEYNDGLS